MKIKITLILKQLFQPSIFLIILILPIQLVKSSQTNNQTNNLLSLHQKPIENSSTNQNQQQKKIEENQKEPGEAYITLFLIVSLFIGAICREIKLSTNIPYTPMLLIFGVLLGAYYKSLGDLGIAIQKILQINPHGILFIFIPTLIFESAFNIDPFVFKKEFKQILVLAIPGVAIGIFLIGFVFNIMLDYRTEFSWSACFAFASIVCATDPVAVVALLKDLGTSMKFNTLLEGESLLNDGTAMVFYIVFSSIVKGQSQNIFLILLKFVQLTFGGFVVGLTISLLIIIWLKSIVKDDVLTFNLLFVTCYLTFFVSEFYLGVSGIISIVTVGIVMGKFGKVSINPESENSIHVIWSYIQYALETILFILTGTYIGKEIIGDGFATITKFDIIKMVIFYFLMIIIRFLMFYILKDYINKIGWEINNKDIVVLTYGGLRGALALCLALMVAIDQEYSIRFREIVLFYITCMISFTVLLNGLTIKYVMNKIKFKERNPVKEKIKIGIKKQLIIDTFKKKSRFLQNKFLKMASWDEILIISGIKQDMLDMKQHQSQESKKQINLKDINKPFINKHEAIIETWIRFYHLLKAEINQVFEESLCSSKTLTDIIELVDLCLEEVEKPIWIWDCVKESSLSTDNIRNYLKFKNTFLIGRFCKKYLISQMLYNYDIIFTLIWSLHKINVTKRVLPINLDYIKIVFAELNVNLKNCEDYLFHLMELFPDLTKSIQQKQAAKMLLNTQKMLLDEFFKKGSITDEEHLYYRTKCEKRLKNIELSQTDWILPKIDSMLLICPLFMKLSKKHFEIIQQQRIMQQYEQNEVIFQKNKLATGVVIIMKGVVQEDNGFYSNTHGMGSILEFGNIVHHFGNSLATLTAITKVKTFFIPKQILIQIMNEDKMFEEMIYKESIFSLFKQAEGIELGLEEDKINFLFNNSEFKHYEQNTLIELKDGGYLFQGQIKEEDYKEREKEDIVYNSNVFIPSSKVDYKCMSDVRLLKFKFAILKISFEDDNRKSKKLSFNRDSFANITNLEKDIDKLYSHLEKKILIN